jgi:hypothetical protein
MRGAIPPILNLSSWRSGLLNIGMNLSLLRIDYVRTRTSVLPNVGCIVSQIAWDDGKERQLANWRTEGGLHIARHCAHSVPVH